MPAQDVNPTLRAELMAALAVVVPQLTGLHDLALVPISGNLLTEINDQIEVDQRRVSLIHAVLDDLNAALHDLQALYADGYPALPPLGVNGTLFEELTTVESQIQAALGAFRALDQIGLDIAGVTFKDQVVPH